MKESAKFQFFFEKCKTGRSNYALYPFSFVNLLGCPTSCAKFKQHTKIGGINIIHIFTDEIPASVDIADFAIGLAHNGEIKDLYDDWQVLNFQSYIFEDEHPGAPKHLHSVNKIAARKTK